MCMSPILKQMQTGTEDRHGETKTELGHLIQQKDRVEERIRRVEHNHMQDRLGKSMAHLRDISDSISDLQNSLNSVWKRTKQIEEEIKQVLSVPFSLKNGNGNNSNGQ